MTTEVTNTSHFAYSIIAEILYKVPRRNLTVFFRNIPLYSNLRLTRTVSTRCIFPAHAHVITSEFKGQRCRGRLVSSLFV